MSGVCKGPDLTVGGEECLSPVDPEEEIHKASLCLKICYECYKFRAAVDVEIRSSPVVQDPYNPVSGGFSTFWKERIVDTEANNIEFNRGFYDWQFRYPVNSKDPKAWHLLKNHPDVVIRVCHQCFNTMIMRNELLQNKHFRE